MKTIFAIFLLIVVFKVVATGPHGKEDIRRPLFYAFPKFAGDDVYELFYTYENHRNKQQMKLNTGEVVKRHHSTGPLLNIGFSRVFFKRWIASLYFSGENILDLSQVATIQYDFIKYEKFKVGVFLGYGGTWVRLNPRYGGGLIASYNVLTKGNCNFDLFVTSQYRKWDMRYGEGVDENASRKYNRVDVNLTTLDTNVGIDFSYLNTHHFGVRFILGRTKMTTYSIVREESRPANYGRSDDYYTGVTLYFSPKIEK